MTERHAPTRPTLRVEHALRRQGYHAIAGIDEAGRGAWAGPVVAAAVILPDLPLAELRRRLPGLDDSKRVTALRRERLREQILTLAVATSVGGAGPTQIDAHGIIAATRAAMLRAIAGLALQPDALVIDALPLPTLDIPQHVQFHADQRICSVAAASILAKCARDHLLTHADAYFPGYAFAAHKGYGTAAHLRALRAHGPSEFHRRSFAPVAACLITSPAAASPAVPGISGTAISLS